VDAVAGKARSKRRLQPRNRRASGVRARKPDARQPQACPA